MIKFCCWRHSQEKWRHNLYFEISLKYPGEAYFADIIKIVTMFIKKNLEDWKKLKELEIMYQNAIYICILWYGKIWLFPMKKCWCQYNSRGESRDLYIFWVFFR